MKGERHPHPTYFCIEMLEFLTAVLAFTGGKSSFSSVYSHYAPVDRDHSFDAFIEQISGGDIYSRVLFDGRYSHFRFVCFRLLQFRFSCFRFRFLRAKILVICKFKDIHMNFRAVHS